MVFHRFEVTRRKPLSLLAQADIKALVIKLLYVNNDSAFSFCSTHHESPSFAYPFRIVDANQYEWHWRRNNDGHLECVFEENKIISVGTTIKINFPCLSSEFVHGGNRERNRIWKLVISYTDLYSLEAILEIPIQILDVLRPVERLKKEKKESIFLRPVPIESFKKKKKRSMEKSLNVECKKFKFIDKDDDSSLEKQKILDDLLASILEFELNKLK
jgi:hypothetical protein